MTTRITREEEDKMGRRGRGLVTSSSNSTWYLLTLLTSVAYVTHTMWRPDDYHPLNLSHTPTFLAAPCDFLKFKYYTVLGTKNLGKYFSSS